MPTYEYECKKCSHRFEVFQAMSDEPVKKCPVCGKEVRRLVSGGLGVIFKGSGFYVTDKDKSSVPKGKNAPKGDAGSKKDAEGGASKSDSKEAPASKTDGVSNGDNSKGEGGANSGGASKEGGATKSGAAKGKAKPAA